MRAPRALPGGRLDAQADNPIPTRVLSDSTTGQRLVHLHIFEHGSAEIDRLLAFRDYLRAHPNEASAYEAEKRRAAGLHPDDSLAYNDAKSDWIKACELRALAWRNPRRK